MNTTSVNVNKSLFVLAQILQRLEYSAEPIDAEQYRAVVARLVAEMDRSARDAGLEALMQAFPAVAELYENLNYRHAGLCRSPLEPALAAELAARAALERIKKTAC